MNSKLSKLKWFLRDCVYPQIEPLSGEASDGQTTIEDQEKEKYVEQIVALSINNDTLVQCLTACAELLDQDEEIRRSIEARLTSTLGLASIAGTIVFGGTLALASGALHVEMLTLRVLMALGSLYLVLQICWAVLASIRGLARRNYIAMNPSDVLPSGDEAQTEYVRRQIALCARRIQDYRSHNRSKVDQMAVAQRALVNFVGGLAVLALLGTSFALASRNTGDQVIQTLKQNHELYEMLRGPQGPQGPKGDPGPLSPSAAPSRQQRRSPGTP
jgi:hypothetical protein